MGETDNYTGGMLLKPLLFITDFYLIYQPNFWTSSYIPTVITLGITIVFIMMLSPYEVLRSIYQLKIFFVIGVILSLGYFAFRAMLSGNDPRVFQNVIIILNVISLVLWLEVLRKYFHFTKKMMC